MQRLALLVIVAATVAHAAPSRSDARADFDRGVAAYRAGEYATAAESLARSYGLEADPETLFAWAQSERKSGHCAKAVDLYTSLLALNLGDENRREISDDIAECKATLAPQKPPPQKLPPPEPPSPPPGAGEQRARWKDPVGGALVGAGLATVIAGTVFLVQAHNARQDRATAATYAEYVALHDRAQSRGRLGIVTTVAGSALVVAGAAWYMLRRQPRTTTVTGWVDSSGGGVGVAGAF